MFAGLSGAASEIHMQLSGLFWILLTPVIVVTITLQFLKNRDENIDPGDALRRTVVAVLLLLSVKYVVTGVADVSDAITAKISQNNSVWEFLEKLGPNYQTGGEDSWFNFKQNAIYILSLLCYLVAYLGFFVSEAIVAFIWSVLYALSPLMILCYVARSTANITANLYKGLVMVASWRILYACLGALLMNMELDKSATGLDDWLLMAVVNLCIGLSMLLVPLFSKSLISDGLSQAGTSLAAGATLAAGGIAKGFAMAASKHSAKLASFGLKPATNPIAGQAELISEKYSLKKRFGAAKQRWQEMNTPKDLVKFRESKRKEQASKKKNQIDQKYRKLGKEIAGALNTNSSQRQAGKQEQTQRPTLKPKKTTESYDKKPRKQISKND